MLVRLFLCLAVSLAAEPAACMTRDRCDRCTSKSLCEPHDEHAGSEIKRLKPALESEDERTRMGALEDLADLSDAHENAPSKAAAKLIASALEDDRLVVREKAIELLTDGQHPEVAVIATVDLLKSYQRAMWTLIETLMGRDGKRGNINEATRFLKTSLEAAGRLRDDRVVDALASVLKAFPMEMRGQPIAQAAVESLLDLGSRGAFQAVIEQFSGLRDIDRCATVQDSLTSAAYAIELDDAPEVDKDWKKAWGAWFKRNRKAFPASLGKWTGENSGD